jgi:carboxypeptidase PM20D1
VRLQTISHAEKEHTDYRPFTRLHAALEKMYPRLHATLQREVVNQYSLLYTWPGREPGLDAVLLYGHLDVVPADPATLTEWTHPPFSGIIADGSMWGRGVLDMKGTVITLCEAVEGLIKVGYQPERTLYLAFGHDEEIGGLDGARAIAGLLETRGVRLAALCDEGGSIMQDVIPGVQLPVALIGIAEKGYVTLELKVEGRPGHSSMPSSHTAIGVLSRAIARIEANPMPARLSMIKLMFDEIGVFMPFSTGWRWPTPGCSVGYYAGAWKLPQPPTRKSAPPLPPHDPRWAERQCTSPAGSAQRSTVACSRGYAGQAARVDAQGNR